MSDTVIDISSFKKSLMAVVGLSVDEALAKYGTDLTPDQAEFLRNLTEQDIINMRRIENRLSSVLGESGDCDGGIF